MGLKERGAAESSRRAWTWREGGSHYSYSKPLANMLAAQSRNGCGNASDYSEAQAFAKIANLGLRCDATVHREATVTFGNALDPARLERGARRWKLAVWAMPLPANKINPDAACASDLNPEACMDHCACFESRRLSLINSAATLIAQCRVLRLLRLDRHVEAPDCGKCKPIRVHRADRFAFFGQIERRMEICCRPADVHAFR